MGMWFTRDDAGFRGWIAAVRNGQLRAGLVNGDFTVTVIAPGDGANTTPTVAESAQKSGVYYFDIPDTFFIANGAGEYVVVLEVDTFAGPSGAPHVQDAVTAVLRVTEEDFDTIAAAVWDEALADHVIPGSYGAELATKADVAAATATDYTVAASGVVLYGTEDAGTYASTFVRDGVYWEVGETGPGGGGLTVELAFYLPSANHRPGSIEMFGRYEGVPATTHFMEAWAYNYESMAWELLVEPCMPGGKLSDDTYLHRFYERHVDRDNNNEVRVRLIHNVATYVASHAMYLDYLALTSIRVITAADIADAVWDEILTDHSGALSAGIMLQGAYGLIGRFRRIDQISRPDGTNVEAARVQLFRNKSDYDAKINPFATFQADAAFVSGLLDDFGQYEV
jgi:hypothetical protein